MVDERFSALTKDPRYRLPSRKEARTAVDPRFARLFSHQDFRRKASVDRYGRKIKPEKQKNELKRLYRLDTEQPKQKSKKVEREVVGSSDEKSEEDDGSEAEEVVKKRDPAREGGFSESASDEDESSDEGELSDDEVELAEETAGQEQSESIPTGEVSRRIAAVNLDWDNIRASDLMAVARSFTPTSGRVESVTIYPSEFGRERLDREELEGPPREIFASSAGQPDHKESEEESDDEDEEARIKKQLLQDQAKEGEEFDTAKLRQYQLERLRYYYAVIECDSDSTAKTLYDSMDGREYLSTSNFFDLRFVPDEVSFEDDKPKEECTKLPSGYKPNDFRTEALTHSKVRLTWDDDDTTRKEAQKRAFSRAEIDENDLRAYIGSDDSDADSTISRKSSAAEKKFAKKEAERAKMRAALGLGVASATKAKREDEPVGDMQITFTSGLSGASAAPSNGVFENEPQDEESTRARYLRKEKERRQKRKERVAAGRTGADGDEKSANEDVTAGAEQEEAGEDLGFNDPFFDDPKAAAAAEKKAKKAEKQAKRAARDARAAEAETRKKELELLMTADGQDDDVRHFDMREIEKAEKESRKKKKKKKGEKSKKEIDGPVDDGFEVDAADPRFNKVLESHEYAIDPTNPRFKKTKGMNRLLEEGRRKRKGGFEEDEEVDGAEGPKDGKKAKVDGGAAGVGRPDELKGLVARLKSKGHGKKEGKRGRT